MTRDEYQGFINKLNEAASVRACNCIGPQSGQPVCPCAMRSVKIVDGRYVQVNDLGPAPEESA